VLGLGKNTSKVKAILFDLDNTLMDFMKMKERAIDAAADAMIDAGLPLSKEEILRGIYDLYEVYGIEDQTIFNKFLEKKMGRISYKILAAGIVAYRRVKEGYVEPYPHVTSTLLKLKGRGYDLFIISDAPTLQAWTRLTGMHLDYLFNEDSVITPEETGVKKPDELPFKKAIEKLKLKPEELLMVGDDPRKDIAGANKLGIITVLARYGCLTEFDSSKSEQKADYEIDDLGELLKLLPSKCQK